MYQSLKGCNAHDCIYGADIVDYLTTDPNSTRFFLKRCYLIPLNAVNIIPTTLFWGGNHSHLAQICGRDYCKIDEDAKEIRVLYSMHSSQNELVKFVQKLAPRKIYPCVMNRFSLGELCLLFSKYLSSDSETLEVEKVSESDADNSIQKYIANQYRDISITDLPPHEIALQNTIVSYESQDIPTILKSHDICCPREVREDINHQVFLNNQIWDQFQSNYIMPPKLNSYRF
jgi:hypothetical protein